jgi:hypothetical protein
MVRPRVACGGGGLQIWKVSENILNKQSQTDDKGWSSSMGGGQSLTTPHREKVQHATNHYTGVCSRLRRDEKCIKSLIGKPEGKEN